MHVAYSVIINGRAIERKAHITAETDTAREKIEAIIRAICAMRGEIYAGKLKIAH